MPVFRRLGLVIELCVQSTISLRWQPEPQEISVSTLGTEITPKIVKMTVKIATEITP